jgi:hypothetical protein
MLSSSRIPGQAFRRPTKPKKRIKPIACQTDFMQRLAPDLTDRQWCEHIAWVRQQMRHFRFAEDRNRK